MNIVSALYPAIPSRLELLKDLLPLHVIRGTQTATVLAGFFLILLADGLRKRRQRAMHVAVVLLLLSSLLNLTKGLDYEEATAAAVLAAALIAGRSTFNVASRITVPRHVLQQLGTFALLYYGYVLGGFLILRRAVRPAPTLLGASAEPLRLIIDAPHYQYLTAQAQWFGRSLAGLGSVALLWTVIQLLRPLIPRRAASAHDVDLVRSLVRRYGSDTLSYFSLQDGRSYFFDASNEAVLSYRLWNDVALVGGDPVGRRDRFPALIACFLDYAEVTGLEPCFLGISPDCVPLLQGAGLRTLKIGEEAVVDLPSFDHANLKRKVRRAVRHVEELGFRTAVYRRDALPLSLLEQMQAISAQWVKLKGGVDRGFSMTLGRLPGFQDRDCEVVVGLQGDTVWGYLCLAPVYQGAGWSLDAMRRLPESPNGFMEFLVARAAEEYRARGYEALSLNFATLSNEEDDIDSRMVESTRRWLYENLSSFYQLKSLYQFNRKFQPRWRSRYLAYRDVLKIPKLALAIVQAEDPIRLAALVDVLRR